MIMSLSLAINMSRRGPIVAYLGGGGYDRGYRFLGISAYLLSLAQDKYILQIDNNSYTKSYHFEINLLG